jgi:hypothetical protein
LDEVNRSSNGVMVENQVYDGGEDLGQRSRKSNSTAVEHALDVPTSDSLFTDTNTSSLLNLPLVLVQDVLENVVYGYTIDHEVKILPLLRLRGVHRELHIAPCTSFLVLSIEL